MSKDKDIQKLISLIHRLLHIERIDSFQEPPYLKVHTNPLSAKMSQNYVVKNVAVKIRFSRLIEKKLSQRQEATRSSRRARESFYFLQPVMSPNLQDIIR